MRPSLIWQEVYINFITVIGSLFLLFKLRISILLNPWCWIGEFCIWSTCNHCYTCNHSAKQNCYRREEVQWDVSLLPFLCMFFLFCVYIKMMYKCCNKDSLKTHTLYVSRFVCHDFETRWWNMISVVANNFLNTPTVDISRRETNTRCLAWLKGSISLTG